MPLIHAAAAPLTHACFSQSSTSILPVSPNEHKPTILNPFPSSPSTAHQNLFCSDAHSQPLCDPPPLLPAIPAIYSTTRSLVEPLPPSKLVTGPEEHTYTFLHVCPPLSNPDSTVVQHLQEPSSASVKSELPSSPDIHVPLSADEGQKHPLAHWNFSKPAGPWSAPPLQQLPSGQSPAILYPDSCFRPLSSPTPPLSPLVVANSNPSANSGVVTQELTYAVPVEAHPSRLQCPQATTFPSGSIAHASTSPAAFFWDPSADQPFTQPKRLRRVACTCPNCVK